MTWLFGGISVKQKPALFVSTSMACFALSIRLGAENNAVNKTMALRRLFCDPWCSYHPFITNRADH